MGRAGGRPPCTRAGVETVIFLDRSGEASHGCQPGRSSVQFSGRFGSPEGTLTWYAKKGCFGADDKVVLVSTGREAYAGGGFHRGAATTHRRDATGTGTGSGTRHTLACGRSGQPNSTPPVSQLPSSKDIQGGKRAGASDAHPKRLERGSTSRRIIIYETSRFRVRARRRPVPQDRRD